MDQGEFMRAQVAYFTSQGIDPDAISREDLASASLTFRKQYETEASKDNHTVKSKSSQ